MSLLKTPNIIDVEASGFGAGSYPIEVGVALASGEKYCSLIRPAPGWTHWDTDAERVHRISRATLETHGKPIKEVALHLNALLRNQTVYSDGWVVDNPWLIQLFFEAQVERSFTFSDLQMILTEEQMAIWHETKNDVIAELRKTRHRASIDAIIVQQTYLRTLSPYSRSA